MPDAVSRGLAAFKEAELHHAINVAAMTSEEQDARDLDALEDEDVLVQVHTSINMADSRQRAAVKRKNAAGTTDTARPLPRADAPQHQIDHSAGGAAEGSDERTLEEGPQTAGEKRARKPKFDVPTTSKYFGFTRDQLKEEATARALVGKGSGQVRPSADKEHLYNALVANDDTS